MHCPNCGQGYVPTLQPLTSKQHEVYTYLVAHVGAHGYAPTYGEIAEHFDYGSLATVNEFLGILERKGYIERIPGEVRAIRCLARLEDVAALAHPAFADRIAGSPNRSERPLNPLGPTAAAGGAL